MIHRAKAVLVNEAIDWISLFVQHLQVKPGTFNWSCGAVTVTQDD